MFETLQQAMLFQQDGQLRKAEMGYRNILKIQPDHTCANHHLGLLAMQVGKPALGLPYVQNAWKTNPTEEICCQTLTECLLQLDHSKDALQLIQNAMQLSGFSSIRSQRLLLLASNIVESVRPALSADQELSALLKAGHYSALEQRLTLLLELYPNWGEGWNLLCTTLQLLGRDSESVLQRALQLLPEDAGSNRQKVFCIGANKTGTKSIDQVFKSLGLIVRDQGHAEILIHDWARNDYRRIIRYCQSADAFQDVPFSLDGTFQAMDIAFPGSKFILTVRPNADEWFDSLVNFLGSIVRQGRIPTAAELRRIDYRYPGYFWDVLTLCNSANEVNILDRELRTHWYEAHNNNIIAYFKDRPDDLLVLDVATLEAMERLLTFLGYPSRAQKIPHLNSSKDYAEKHVPALFYTLL